MNAYGQMELLLQSHLSSPVLRAATEAVREELEAQQRVVVAARAYVLCSRAFVDACNPQQSDELFELTLERFHTYEALLAAVARYDDEKERAEQ
jgi:hypothetical protein